MQFVDYLYNYKISNKYVNLKVAPSTWLLAIYLFTAPLDFIQVIPGVSLMRFLIFLPLVGSLLKIKRLRIYLDKYFIILLLYIFIVILSTMFSINASSTINRTISIGQNIGVILFLSMFRYNLNEIIIIIKSMVYSGWFTVLLMILYSDYSLMGGRMTIAVNGVFQDPNYLIGFLMFSVVYYYGEFLNKKSGLSLLNLFVFILFVLLTGSRGGFLAILGAVAFYTIVWLKNKGNGITSIIKFISILFVLSFLLSLSINLLPESIQQRYDLSYTLEDGGANRFDIWEITINSYSNLPLLNQSFGTGAGTIGNIFNGDGVSHNIWLESLVEIGIIGTTILFLLYLFFFIKMYIQKEFIISAVFVGYMIMAMSLSLYSYKPIWNILLLIIIIKNYNCDVE